MGLVAGVMTLCAVACSHDRARYQSNTGGGPSGAESSYSTGNKGAGQMSQGDYGMYGNPNVSTSGGKPGSQGMQQSTGGGPTSGTQTTIDTDRSMQNNSSNAPNSSSAPWYENAR
jgi:hypothetical protein